MWTLDSPNKELKVMIEQQGDGSLRYCVSKHGKRLLRKVPWGFARIWEILRMVCSLKRRERFHSGRIFHSRGEKEVYTNHAQELALCFRAHESEFTVRLRAFDDGMAFRYEISTSGRIRFW